jgi:CRP/FNR family transcriptional regulator, anaerobic regulatory protein
LQTYDTKRIHHLFPYLTSIPAEDWSKTEIRTITPDTPHDIREGHIFHHAMFILQGTVRIHKISEQGREVTLYRVQDGQCCVLMMASVLGDTAYEASASIEAETEVLLIPIELFKKWMNLHQPLRTFIFQQIIHRITAVTDLLENIAFKPISYRVAEYLLRQSDPNPISITHEQLAIELGTAREVVSRTLKDFANKNMIVLHRRQIEILDRPLLLQLLENHER